jgi:6-pyruvoyltetrahydropterin/6-carboxytetrahydropterin synthase
MNNRQPAEPLYSVTVRREFVAWHFLIGGDFGPENARNSHHYRVEVRYEGPRLDHHGFLLDIAEIRRLLDGLVERYRDQTLNDFPEFAGLNPSVENFARILSQRLAPPANAAPDLTYLEVTVWEDGDAAASYRRGLAPSGSRRPD